MSTTISSQSPATTFPLFHTLPFELRLKIWEAAIENSPAVGEAGEKRFYSPECIPALLHVCQESRREASKVLWLYDVDDQF